MALRFAIIFTLVVLLGYGVIKAFPLLSGPSLSIKEPARFETKESASAFVSGTAYNTETLYLNDGPLLIDEHGRFYRELTLPQGGAILELTAEDRFGRSVTEQRTIFIP